MTERNILLIIYIAIDEHQKFTGVVSILEAQKVVKLDKENVLFIKKWNKILASK